MYTGALELDRSRLYELSPRPSSCAHRIWGHRVKKDYPPLTLQCFLCEADFIDTFPYLLLTTCLMPCQYNVLKNPPRAIYTEPAGFGGLFILVAISSLQAQILCLCKGNAVKIVLIFWLRPCSRTSCVEVEYTSLLDERLLLQYNDASCFLASFYHETLPKF